MEVTKLQKGDEHRCGAEHEYPVPAEYAVRAKGVVEYMCLKHKNEAVKLQKMTNMVKRKASSILGIDLK